MKKIFIVTGEHSGDLHAAYIVREIKRLIPDIEIKAVGGQYLQAEGVELFSDQKNMQTVGLGFLKSIFSHIDLGRRIVKFLKKDFKPDLVLLIDYGGFNIRLAKYLKKSKFDVFYYIAPQIWASRKGRINKIKKYFTKVMLILPFEEEIYKKEDIDAVYVGHPLISELKERLYKEDFIREAKIDVNKKVIGIFPGSRKMEIDYLLPVFLESALKISKVSQKVQFCLAQSSNISDEMIQGHLEKFNKKHKDNGLEIKILKHKNHSLLKFSDVVMLASGTVTLEAAIYKTPAVVSYKGPFIVYLIYLMVRYIKFLALPNVIMDKEVVKEFLQYDAKATLIAHEVLSILHNQDKREEILKNYDIVIEKLGSQNASYEAAKIISSHLKEKKPC